MKKALLITGGTVAGIAAVLSYTPAQLTSALGSISPSGGGATINSGAPAAPSTQALAETMAAREMRAHVESQYGQGERQRDPEPSRHIRKFRTGRSVERDKLRLKRHAADRATPSADLLHLRMHRAGVDRILWHGRRFALVEIAHRIGFELRAASGAAEMVCLAFVTETWLARVRIDCHAANRIDRLQRPAILRMT